MNPKIGGLLLIGGVMLLLLGSAARQWGVVIDSVPVETTAWYLVAGSVSTMVGLFAVTGRLR
jgi:hypothetical protein